MSNSILSSLFSKATFTAKSEISNTPVWQGLKIISVEIGVSAAESEQPLGINQESENAVLISLNQDDIKATKILQPSVIKITGICPDLSTTENVISMFANPQQTLTITSKGVMAVNMAVTSIEVVQESEMISASRVEITLEQSIMPMSASSWNPSQPADANALPITTRTTE